MEANSIPPLKADYRPTGTQARSELGNIFQDLLRDTAWQLDTPVAASPYDNRPKRAEFHRDSWVEAWRTDVSARSDTRNRLDDDTNDFSALEVQIPAAPQPSRSTADGSDGVAPFGRTDETSSRQTDESGQRPQGEASRAAAANTGAQQPDKASASDAPAGTIASPLATSAETAPSPEQAKLSVGGANAATQVNAGFTSDLGQGTGKSGAETSALGKTAEAGPGAASSQARLAAAAAATGVNAGDGVAQVTVKAAPALSQPAVTLGGGAATAAIAGTTPQDAAGPTTPSAESGSRAAQGGPTPGAATLDRTISGPGNTQAPAPNARTLAGDGPNLVAQSANSAAAVGAVSKLDPAATARQGRGTETTPGQGTDADQPDAPIQTGQTVTGRNGSPSGTPPTQPSGTGEPFAGQNTPGQGDGSKAANSLNPDARASQQAQSDLPPRTPAQTPAPANATAAPAPGTPALPSEPFGPARDSGGPSGSSGRADAATGQGMTPTQVATGGLTQPAHASSGALGSAGQTGASHATPADQIAVEIQKAVGAGKDHIRVRLNPAELGQIDVSLKVRHDGTIRAIVTADRPETYDLLQRDSRGLERALSDAGLKTDSGSLSFNLRGGDSNGPNGGQSGANGMAQGIPDTDRAADAIPENIDVPPPLASNHALDIRV